MRVKPYFILKTGKDESSYLAFTDSNGFISRKGNPALYHLNNPGADYSFWDDGWCSSEQIDKDRWQFISGKFKRVKESERGFFER